MTSLNYTKFAFCIIRCRELYGFARGLLRPSVDVPFYTAARRCPLGSRLTKCCVLYGPTRRAAGLAFPPSRLGCRVTGLYLIVRGIYKRVRRPVIDPANTIPPFVGFYAEFNARKTRAKFFFPQIRRATCVRDSGFVIVCDKILALFPVAKIYIHEGITWHLYLTNPPPCVIMKPVVSYYLIAHLRLIFTINYQRKEAKTP